MRITLMLVVILASAVAIAEPRARDLGVPFDGEPGPLNAITDVAGVAVGHTTVIEDFANGHKARTGVTAILPRGRADIRTPVFGGWFSLNGNGEMTGTTWIDEGGFMEGPVFITNTHSVGVVRDAAIAWSVKQGKTFQPWSLPVVAETWDGTLNDINGFHVKPEHVVQAIESAATGRVPEGNVGGGTGMICYEFKCGTGTASRKLPPQAGGYTVGVLVQANHGRRPELRIAGVPVGQEIPVPATPKAGGLPPMADEQGSIIIVVATDAPLLPHQLERIARRATMGLARTGATSGNGSGDIFLAFSTENHGVAAAPREIHVNMLSNSRISALFSATVEATEEAIINAMIGAGTMTGVDGNRVDAIPHEKVRELMGTYRRVR